MREVGVHEAVARLVNAAPAAERRTQALGQKQRASEALDALKRLRADIALDSRCGRPSSWGATEDALRHRQLGFSGCYLQDQVTPYSEHIAARLTEDRAPAL
jgi:hypothetical protein